MPTDTHYEREQTQEHAYFNGRINQLLSQLASEEAMSQTLERERDEAHATAVKLERALQKILAIANEDMNDGRMGWGTQDTIDIATAALEEL